MFYCKKCVFPSTRPLITFDDEGVCSACRQHDKKKQVDWKSRERLFFNQALYLKQANPNSCDYDCIVPVSGGKDSLYQVSKAREYGLRVLAVNVDYGIRTDVGRHNLSIVSDKLGADLLSFKPGRVHKQLIKYGFLEFGDADFFSHGLLYSYPLWIAKEKGIPMVLFGENPASEYTGENLWPGEDWFSKYVMNLDKYNAFLVQHCPIAPYIKQYVMPKRNYRRIAFLGDYFYWDSEAHAQHAYTLGFRQAERPVGTYRKWVGVDEVIHRVHQYFKVLKFGYGRATDHACEDIREGKITRERAIELVLNHDNDPLPNVIRADFCNYVGVSHGEFDAVVDKFRNKDIWKLVSNRWALDRDFNKYKE